jgi:hypothetical protein
MMENFIKLVPLSRVDNGGRVSVHDGADVKNIAAGRAD